jgi:hypothetical protein
MILPSCDATSGLSNYEADDEFIGLQALFTAHTTEARCVWSRRFIAHFVSLSAAGPQPLPTCPPQRNTDDAR